MIQSKALLIFILCATTSCGMLKRGEIPWEQKPKTSTPVLVSSTSKATSKVAEPINLSKKEADIKTSLDLAFKDWKGVPYVLGGTGYSGVDCSSFMQIVFADYFEIELPRNTRQQMKEGGSVKKNKIKMGDLVFFKTGRNTFHVGVMVNNEQFLHASTSSGVMVSGLKERYWSDAYLTTRRIFKS